MSKPKPSYNADYVFYRMASDIRQNTIMKSWEFNDAEMHPMRIFNEKIEERRDVIWHQVNQVWFDLLELGLIYDKLI